jgi:hypothetical protein
MKYGVAIGQAKIKPPAAWTFTMDATSITEAARTLHAAPALAATLKTLVAGLEELGFGGEDEISGADTVEAMAEHYAHLRRVLKEAGL